MVINNKRLLKVLAMALSMSALSLMAADVSVTSDKDEKEAHAHEQVDKKEIAAFIKDIPDQIPFVIPEAQQIKRDGKPVEEFIRSDDDEALLLAPFRSIIETALNKKEQPILFRVVTQDSNGRDVMHYFDVEELRKAIAIFGGLLNPSTRQPIRHLSCYVYIPEFKRFHYVHGVKSPQLIPTAHLQELALFQVTSAFDQQPEYYKKRRMLLTFLSEQATNSEIKNTAHFNLALSLYYGEGGPHDRARACQLLELVTKIGGKKVAVAHTLLALWYYEQSGENRGTSDCEKIRDHALQVIGDEAAMKDLIISRQAEVYRIAGELLLRDTHHAQTDKALSFLTKALDLGKKAMELPAEQAKLSPGFIARVHAHLALCHYHAPLHGAPEYTLDQGRYERVWHHCTQALSGYEQVESINGFVDMLIEMHYFALGTEGDVKKALELCKKQYPHDYSSSMDPVLSHYDYYHASIKKPSKRKEAIESLQMYIDKQEYGKARGVRYYMALALLGEMYLHESDRARDLAKLHITTDAEFSRDCDKQADALDAKAKELFNCILTKMPRGYRSSYAWALTHLLLAQKELKSPVKNYETVSNYLGVIYQEREEFPLLASNACVLIDDIQRTDDFESEEDGGQYIHPKDPRYYEKMFEQAMSDYNTVTPDSAHNVEEFLVSIHDRFEKVAHNSTNALLKAQAQQAVKITEKEFALIKKMLNADKSTDEGRAFKKAAIARLACSKSKSIREYYEDCLKIEEDERASLSLDASLDAPVEKGGSLAMPEDAEPASMDARPDADAPRGTKRKPEQALLDPRARDEAGAGSISRILNRKQTNGAGSGSA